jgi:hypothetical protein
VGRLTYTVIDIQWSRQLGDMSNVRIARDQFLLLRLNVTNGGGTALGIPLLKLIGPQQQAYPELEDCKELKDWLGLVRSVEPAATEDGWIAFDVPLAEYQLQVSSGELDNEALALISLPMRMG